jgi:hypothetical protein
MGIEAIRRAILLKKPLLSIKNDSVGLKKNLYIETINLKISSKKRNEIKISLKQNNVKNKAKGIDKKL